MSIAICARLIDTGENNDFILEIITFRQHVSINPLNVFILLIRSSRWLNK